MDSRDTKNIWIGLVVVALVIGAYYFGTSLREQTESTNNNQDVGAEVPTQETSPQQNQVAPIDTPKPKVVQTQNTDINFELSENPDYLFSKSFNPNKVKVYGVGIGDPISAIDQSIIDYNASGLPNNIYTKRAVTYSTANGKVTEISLTHNGVYNNLTTENDIIMKFGSPDQTKTKGNPPYITNTYYYVNKGLIVSYFQLGATGGTVIIVNISGNY